MNLRQALLLMTMCGLVIGASSQDRVSAVAHASASAQASSPAGPRPKPRNLTVLPKDISGADLDRVMHEYAQDLGTSCGYCHAENPQSKEIDFASDENPMKETARLMIAMTKDINTKYLAELGDRRYADAFTCGNCHRGQIKPPAFEPKPQP